MAALIKLLTLIWPLMVAALKNRGRVISYMRKHVLECMLMLINILALIIFIFMYAQAMGDAQQLHEAILANEHLTSQNLHLKETYADEKALIETYIRVHEIGPPAPRPIRPPQLTPVLSKHSKSVRARPRRFNQTLSHQPIIR
jgi:hypothetical protein